MSFPSVTQRGDRLADVRAQLHELRQRRGRAQERQRDARKDVENYNGSEPIHQSPDFMRLEAAIGDVDEITQSIERFENDEKYILSTMAGYDGPIHNDSFLHDPALLDQLRHMGTSEARIGRMDLGYVLDRDEFLASIQRESIYNRQGMMAAAGDVTVPAGARGRYYGQAPQLARPLRLLDLLPVAPMDVGSFDYTPISGNLDTAAEVLDLSVKATADIVLGSATAKAQTVAHYHKIAKPQLADVPGLQDQLENRLVYGVNRRIEQAAINGDGIDPHLLGVLNVSGIGAPASVAGDASNADLVLNAKGSVNKAGGVANGIVMHTDDINQALKLKASTSGVRLDSGGAFQAVPSKMWDLNLVETSVTAVKGKAIVADWSIAVTMFVREGVHVLVSDADQNDFTTNRLTLLGEARVAFAWWQPSAIAVVNLTFPA